MPRNAHTSIEGRNIPKCGNHQIGWPGPPICRDTGQAGKSSHSAWPAESRQRAAIVSNAVRSTLPLSSDVLQRNKQRENAATAHGPCATRASFIAGSIGRSRTPGTGLLCDVGDYSSRHRGQRQQPKSLGLDGQAAVLAGAGGSRHQPSAYQPNALIKRMK